MNDLMITYPSQMILMIEPTGDPDNPNFQAGENMSKAESTDALMATLGEYDALWDGTLPPEIIDAEFYDCPDSGGDHSPNLPTGMYLSQDFDLMQIIDRYEALLTLLEVVKCYVGTCTDAPLFSEDIDGEFYDCPVSGWVIDDPPQDWPSVESLK